MYVYRLHTYTSPTNSKLGSRAANLYQSYVMRTDFIRLYQHVHMNKVLCMHHVICLGLVSTVLCCTLPNGVSPNKEVDQMDKQTWYSRYNMAPVTNGVISGQ